ncbi:MAG TPA: hypothetical protein QGG77_01240 [Prochlorococcaceae cyanobacterium Gl_MAG_24]|nr:hypothetical protein [Prochlorococcaceae cyanobacterium Gl_MAG_24]
MVLLLQVSFHWLLEQATVISTPIFELSGLGWLLLLLGAWLLAGQVKGEGSSKN